MNIDVLLNFRFITNADWGLRSHQVTQENDRVYKGLESRKVYIGKWGMNTRRVKTELPVDFGRICNLGGSVGPLFSEE